jgi:hypothetical protein
MRFLLPVLGLFLITACKHEPLEPVGDLLCPEPLSYAVDILPIIQASCNMGGCHAGAYNTYEGIQPKILSGALVDRVFNRAGDPVLGMPPAMNIYPSAPYQELSEADMEVLRCWVRQGYPR